MELLFSLIPNLALVGGTKNKRGEKAWRMILEREISWAWYSVGMGRKQ